MCSKSKKSTEKERAPMQIVAAGLPMERNAIEIVGELPMTRKGNRYILVISDYFTKWVESFPKEAETVANILAKEVIARFGVPGVI